jgi:hypothetical protein
LDFAILREEKSRFALRAKRLEKRAYQRFTSAPDQMAPFVHAGVFPGAGLRT